MIINFNKCIKDDVELSKLEYLIFKLLMGLFIVSILIFIISFAMSCLIVDYETILINIGVTSFGICSGIGIITIIWLCYMSNRGDKNE